MKTTQNRLLRKAASLFLEVFDKFVKSLISIITQKTYPLGQVFCYLLYTI